MMDLLRCCLEFICLFTDWYPLHSVESSLKLMQKISRCPDVTIYFLSKAVIGLLSKRHQKIEPSSSDLTDEELKQFLDMLDSEFGSFLCVPDYTIPNVLRGLAESNYNRKKLQLYYDHESKQKNLKWPIDLAVMQKQSTSESASDTEVQAEATHFSSLHLIDQDNKSDDVQLSERSKESLAEDIMSPLSKHIHDHAGNH